MVLVPFIGEVELGDANKTQIGMGSMLGHSADSMEHGANPKDGGNHRRHGGGG